MDTLTIVGSVIGIAGSLTYATYQRNKRLGEREFLRYVSRIAYSRLASGDHTLWEDLKKLYTDESERLFGAAGPLTASESYELTRFIDALYAKSGAVDMSL